MAQIISIEALPAQRFQVQLAGQSCTIKLYQRFGKMYLDLYVGEQLICAGALCQFWADILQIRTPDFVGFLRWLDMEGQAAPTFDGIGSRYFLVYFESEADELFQEIEGMVYG